MKSLKILEGSNHYITLCHSHIPKTIKCSEFSQFLSETLLVKIIKVRVFHGFLCRNSLWGFIHQHLLQKQNICRVCQKAWTHYNARIELIEDRIELTYSRSRPSSSKFGTADDNFWGFHWGYSCQFISLLTPGHISSFGVPSNLNEESQLPSETQIATKKYKKGTVGTGVIFLLNLKMCRSCCSSESPGKSACLVISSAKKKKKKNQFGKARRLHK